jgi:geranylgeranyl pyrophosphate synthase
LLTLARLDGSPRAGEIERVVNGVDVSDADYAAVASLIEQSGALDESLDAARTYTERAISRLGDIRDREAADQLAAFARLALERSS